MFKKLSERTQGFIVNTVALTLISVVFCVLSANGYFKASTATILWNCCIFILLTTSLNITMGGLGQLALGHCGFMAVGAYASVYAVKAFTNAGLLLGDDGLTLAVKIAIALLAGAAAASVMGIIVGFPAMRVSGDYLAIITLGFNMIVLSIIYVIPGTLSGNLAQDENPIAFTKDQKISLVGFAVILTIICVMLIFLFFRSKYGRAIKAINNDAIAAEASGINTSYYKILTFAFSSMFAGIAGAMSAFITGNLNPANFQFSSTGIQNSIFIVVLVVFGGVGSITGSVFTGGVMYILNDYIADMGQKLHGAPDIIKNLFMYPMLVYALVLIIVIIFRPKGVFGRAEFSLIKTIKATPRFFKRLFSKKSKKEEN